MGKTKEVLRFEVFSGPGVTSDRPQLLDWLRNRSEYLHRAEAAGVTWPLGEDWHEGWLENALFGGPPQAPRPGPQTLPPD